MKNSVIVVGVFVSGLIFSVGAVQYNYVETTTYNVDGAGTNEISTSYTDGLERSIQSKLKLGSGKDRVTCTYYDENGRQKYITKAFIDKQYAGTFLPGDLSDPTVRVQLENTYQGETAAYFENEYWDDGRIKFTKRPGVEFAGYESRKWTIGVPIQTNPESISITENSTDFGTLTFRNGLLTDILSTDVAACIDKFDSQQLAGNLFSTDRTHILVISLVYDDVSGAKKEYISEELKDKIGRTIRVLISPTINSHIGLKVITENNQDIVGNVLEEIPPKSGASTLVANTEYRYNTIGQVIWKKTPDGGEFEFGYRNDGQIDYVLSFTGASKTMVRKVQYTYDNAGRTIYINSRYPGPLGDVVYDQVRYFYDDLSFITTQPVFSSIPQSYLTNITNLRGRLAGRMAINHVNGQRYFVGEVYSYDDEGRLKCRYLSMTGAPFFQQNYYTYDIHGKIITDAFYYGGDHILKVYSYDQLGRLSSIKHGKLQPNGIDYTFTVISERFYDDLGRDSTTHLSAMPGEYKTIYDYDILDKITKLKTVHEVGNVSTYIFNESIRDYDSSGNSTTGYTKSGNIKNIRYYYNGTTPEINDYEYTYDDINRLGSSTKKQGANIIESNAYNYDILDRFTSKDEGSNTLSNYTFYPLTNRLKSTSKNSDPSMEYIYDKHGNLVVDFTKKMVIEYDWRDMPIAFRFYSDLSTAGLTKDATGTYIGSDLYSYMSDKVNDQTSGINLVATVIMLYDVDGNRVCKMEVRE